MASRTRIASAKGRRLKVSLLLFVHRRSASSELIPCGAASAMRADTALICRAFPHSALLPAKLRSRPFTVFSPSSSTLSVLRRTRQNTTIDRGWSKTFSFFCLSLFPRTPRLSFPRSLTISFQVSLPAAVEVMMRWWARKRIKEIKGRRAARLK